MGSFAVKAVALSEDRVVAKYRDELLSSAEKAVQKALGILYEDIGCFDERGFSIIVTGMGMHRARYRYVKKSEVTCLARGARRFCEKARTVIDIGAENTKVLNLDEEGNVLDVIRNTKCAAGTAMMLKIIGRVLDIPMAEMDRRPFSAGACVKLSHVCTVFAESEAISYLSQGVSPEHVLAGMHISIVDGLISLIEQLDVAKEIVLVGGTANNSTISALLSDRLGLPVFRPPEPDMVVAVGAALVGRDLKEGR